MARGLKFRIYKVEGLYYQCSENKGADRLPRSGSAPLFSHMRKSDFLMTPLILCSKFFQLSHSNSSFHCQHWHEIKAHAVPHVKIQILFVSLYPTNPEKKSRYKRFYFNFLTRFFFEFHHSEEFFSPIYSVSSLQIFFSSALSVLCSPATLHTLDNLCRAYTSQM